MKNIQKKKMKFAIVWGGGGGGEFKTLGGEISPPKGPEKNTAHATSAPHQSPPPNTLPTYVVLATSWSSNFTHTESSSFFLRFLLISTSCVFFIFSFNLLASTHLATFSRSLVKPLSKSRTSLLTCAKLVSSAYCLT